VSGTESSVGSLESELKNEIIDRFVHNIEAVLLILIPFTLNAAKRPSAPPAMVNSRPDTVTPCTPLKENIGLVLPVFAVITAEAPPPIRYNMKGNRHRGEKQMPSSI